MNEQPHKASTCPLPVRMGTKELGAEKPCHRDRKLGGSSPSPAQEKCTRNWSDLQELMENLLPRRTKEATITVGSQVPAKDKNKTYRPTINSKQPEPHPNQRLLPDCGGGTEGSKEQQHTVSPYSLLADQALRIRETDTQPASAAFRR